MEQFVLRKILLLAVFIALAASRVPTTASAQSHALLQQQYAHVASAISRAKPLGLLAPTDIMHVSMSLPLRNQTELETLLQDLYDPASPRYGHYLTSAEFTERFGPTDDDYRKLQSFATAHGMKVTQTFANRVVVTADVPVAAAETAFHVRLRRYQRADGTTFHAPDDVPAIDRGSPVDILCVGGLDDAVPPHHLSSIRFHSSSVAAGGAESGVTNQNGIGGGYSPDDMRKAYDVPSALTGTGQTVSIFALDGYDPQAIATFQKGYGTNVPLENVYLDETTPDNQGFSDESVLDIEMEIGMAPQATKLIAYLGDEFVTIFSQYVTENRAKVMSSSYAANFGTKAAEHGLLQQMAAQGQSFYHAGGDNGYNTGPADNPNQDPYETSVGWNTLYTYPDGSWQNEVPLPYSSGGISEWPLPSFQTGIDLKAVGGSTTQRNWPDIAMVGTSVSVYDSGGWETAGGASAASPILAGLTALINQQRALNGKGPLGFVNPAIYGVYKGAYYANDFHDQITGDNRNDLGGKLAAVGYDLVTGVGTPILCNLLTDLGGGTTGDFRLNFDPVVVPQGTTSTSTITVAGLHGFSSNVELSLDTLPPGLTASLSTTTTSTTSTLTVTADIAAQGDGATQGNCFVKVTAVSGSLTHVAYVPVTVRATNGTRTAVDLSSVYNAVGISTDGSSFLGDGINNGTAYSSKLLGPSLKFAGVKFTFGSPNVNNAVVGSAVVPLPRGSYTRLSLLGGGFNDFQQLLPFKVNYTDGTMTTFTQGVCDYGAVDNYEPGETIVSRGAPYANNSDGTRTINFYPSLYGYSFALDPAKTVKSFTLPGDEFFTLGIALVNVSTVTPTYKLTATPASVKLAHSASVTTTVAVKSTSGFNDYVTLTASSLPAGVTAVFSPANTTGLSKLTLTASSDATLGNSPVIVTGTSSNLIETVIVPLTVGIAPAPVSLISYYNLEGLTTDGQTFTTGGLDGKGHAFSGSLITPPVNWHATLFDLGPGDSPNAVSGAGQTIPLPGGMFTTLRMLAASVQSSEPAQPFTVTYTDGTTKTFTQGISKWTAPQNYAGEHRAVSEIYRNSQDGTKDDNEANIYGYSLSIDHTKTTKSITLPNNSNVKILALTLVP